MESEIRYAELLVAYLRARPVQPKRTLLEIAGQSAKERVWSLLLAHFLDPREGHGMSPLFLHALTRAAGTDEAGEAVEEVAVEVQTARGKLIDVMATTDRRVIVIENKIYAPPYNDFDEYRREAHARAEATGKRPLLIVLTLRPVDRRAAGFVNVRWSRFRQEVCERSGPLLAQPPSQHTIYLQEFMSMVGNVHQERTQDKAFTDFVMRHEQDIAGLYEEVERMRNELSRRSDEFARATTLLRAGRKPQPAQYRERAPKLFATTYFDLPTSCGTRLAIDVVFEPRGCRIEVFCRARSRTVEFLPGLRSAGVVLRDLGEGSRHEWEKAFEPAVEPTELASQVSALLDIIEKVLSVDPGHGAAQSRTQGRSTEAS